MRLNRTDKSLLAQWWFSVDRLLLAAILMVMAAGLVLSLAASPAVAVKLGYEPLHFFKRHALWFVAALFLLFSTSLLAEKQVRRLCLILFATGTALMIFVLLFGGEVNGAHRWLKIGSLSLQPSEFVKPAFVILTAWFFAEDARRPDMPGKMLALGLYGLFALLLILQPDFGQVVLITAVWGAIYFLAGAPMVRIGLMGIMAFVSMIIAYFALPHVHARINRFFDPASGDTYQTDRAAQSFADGGWFGRGPGEGLIKRSLPDSHTDFTFAVIAEEFGVITCLIVLALFCFVVLRVLSRTMAAENRFIGLGASGLVIMVGLQAIINMAVNTGLIPAKGMTLPFLSYGGSSLLGLSIAMGIVLGLTRRPFLRAKNEDLPGILRSKNGVKSRRTSPESLV